MKGYDKCKRNNSLIWNEETKQTFETLKLAVSQAQMLYFEDNTNPVYLRTDASDFGIGAYLFQNINGEEKPIMFLSKSLVGEQLRWSTPEKECYAIIFVLTKMEHLLKDRHFFLQTDHDNLTKVYSSGSAKVLRWKLRMQEYNYTISYLKGEDNDIADAFSRLCAIADNGTNFISALDEEKTSAEYYSFKNVEFINSINAELLNSIDSNIKPIPHKIYKTISKVHNSITGHHGQEKTLKNFFEQENISIICENI